MDIAWDRPAARCLGIGAGKNSKRFTIMGHKELSEQSRNPEWARTYARLGQG